MHAPRKTAIVTGASQGIGAGIVRAFVERGFNVVANSRKMTQSAEVSASDHIALVDGHIGEPATAARIVETALSRFKSIDALVNNAGIFFTKPFTDYTPEDFRSLISTNLEGFLYVTQLAIKQMLAQKTAGSIVTITAALARNPIRGVTAAVPMITKGGLETITQHLAMEYAKDGIRVNAVAPGVVDTPMHENDPKEILQSLNPMGVVSSIQDIVDAVMYLTEAATVTGDILYVDGGGSFRPVVIENEDLEMSDQSNVPAWAKTRVSQRLGIRYPIIQGPLGGMMSQRLTAAVSNYGGLGSFGAHGLTPGAIKDVIAQLRSMTDKPFEINLWVSMEDEGARTSDEAAFKRSLATLAPLIESLGETLPSYKPYSPMKFEDQARVLIDAKVPAFSFIYGIPPKEILDECRTRGILLIGTATTPDEAVELQKATVDIIVASGFEAGGHRGSFLRAAEDSLTGTFSLVPQIADRVSIPVVAAGGIADARGIVAAFALGAQGVQIGTAFLACEESGASQAHRDALLSGKAGTTALTRGFTGRLARAIRNRLLDTMNAPGAEILPYPLQRFLMRNVSAMAEKSGREELIPMWAGQSANLVRHARAVELLDALVSGVSAVID